MPMVTLILSISTTKLQNAEPPQPSKRTAHGNSLGEASTPEKYQKCDPQKLISHRNLRSILCSRRNEGSKYGTLTLQKNLKVNTSSIRAVATPQKVQPNHILNKRKFTESRPMGAVSGPKMRIRNQIRHKVTGKYYQMSMNNNSETRNKQWEPIENNVMMTAGQSFPFKQMRVNILRGTLTRQKCDFTKDSTVNCSPKYSFLSALKLLLNFGASSLTTNSVFDLSSSKAAARSASKIAVDSGRPRFFKVDGANSLTTSSVLDSSLSKSRAHSAFPIGGAADDWLFRVKDGANSLRTNSSAGRSTLIGLKGGGLGY
uniref:Uncharacterized protein n=1 Tax=Romanomermis culicivorax TaxID=13658 RepID=A0A915HWW8_ROMCU